MEKEIDNNAGMAAPPNAEYWDAGITQMIQQVIRVRVLMDELIENHGSLVSLPLEYHHRSEESLILSRMWLGKVLGALGKDYPYKESTNPESTVIENPTDKAASLNYPSFTTFTNCLEVVKGLRHEIHVLSDMIRGFKETVNVMDFSSINRDIDHVMLKTGIDMALTSCIESGMWLGMSLNVIDKYRNGDPLFNKNVTLSVY